MKLLIGPWIGEFGWELFCWQSFMRVLVKKYQPSDVVCVTRKGHELLYRDFSKTHNFELTSGKANMFMLEDMSDSDSSRIADLHEHYKKLGYEVIPPLPLHYKGTEVMSPFGFPISPEFIRYGEKKEECSFDAIFHARSRSLRSSDNWDQDKWILLAKKAKEMGLKVACIGSLQESSSIDGTTDLRGIELEKLVDYLASSKLIVGPSSGPMHLATLCGCPQLVWSGNPNNKVRYEKEWNPFSTKVKYMDLDEGGWHPDPLEVFDYIVELIK